MEAIVRRRLIGVVALGALLLAAAGGGWWWSQGRQPSPGAAGPTVQADPSKPFAALECKPRLFDDRPALAVVFSQPVDGKQNLGELMRVVDLGDVKETSSGEGKLLQGAWVVSDNPRVVYFPAIQPQRRFRIEVSAELRSADGAKLAQSKRCEVTSEAMPPSFYFASRGVVLPAGQNGGLPVVTVNVPEVDLQFLKVEPAAMPRFFERVAGVRRAQARSEESEEGEEGTYGWGEIRRLKGAVSGWELEQLRPQTRSVYLGRFTTEETPNKRRVTFIPVETIKELQEPGVYVAVMNQPGRFAWDYQVTYFYVSDIGVQVHRYAKAMDAFATSLKSGSALGGVSFELLDENARVVAKAAGDGDGHAAFANVPEGASLLVARRGEGAKAEMTTIVLREPGLDLSEFDVGGHPSRSVKLFAYAGRDLYRPGERFELSVLVRDADGKPLAPQPIAATLKRPDGRTVSTATWQAQAARPGYLQQAIELPPDAQTGTWLLELRGDPGAKRPDTVWKFQVEEFLPERMKLDLSSRKEVLMAGEAFDVQVKGDYLFGAPAAGNRLMVSAATERQRIAMPQKWPGFVFGDFADDQSKKREEVADQSLDDQGRAQVTLPMSALGANSPMLVRGSFSLLESGGRPVVRSIERVVWPTPKLLAVRPLFERDVAREGGKAEFELIRVDANGKLQPLKSVPLRLVREDREYYWRFDDQRGWQSGYTEADEVVEAGAVAMQGERTMLALPVRWGRYRLELEDPETHQRLRYRFYAGWGAQEAEDIGNRPDRVQLKLAKAPLKAGDTAELSITPPHDGTALVTVEGDRLLWSKRVPVSAEGTKLGIPVDASWARHDLYITVTAFRPGSQGDRVTPARAVGLVHLPLSREDRQLKVALQAPAKVLPEKRATVKIKVDGLAGQSGFVTLSAVDAGILGITRYKSPDAFDFFFGKHRFAAELTDMYGKLIEKMEGATGKLKFGGDSKMRDSKSLPKKVKLVDLFSGPVALNAKGEAEVPLDIPDFNGTLRLMAVVATPERYGRAEAEMVSAAPIAAELAMPRFISPGDAATLALDVTNLSGAPQDIKVQLEGAEPLRVREGDKALSLKDKQRMTLRFPVEATDAYGLGRLRLQVTSASGLKIVREAALQVQPPVALEREARRVKLEPGASFRLDAAQVERYFKASANVSLSVSDKPPLNINRLVQGLLDYPYGCLEQTTSAAYPHVFIDEAAAKAYGLKPRSRDERARFIEGAIARLAGMQKANGGFTLWGDGPYELWLSAYVMGFMQDARAQGFSVPDGMVKTAQEWMLQQLQQAPNRFPTLPREMRDGAASSPLAPAFNDRDYNLLRDSHQRFAELAHIGYMLARDQKAPLAMLRYLHDQVRDRARSPLPLVHLSIALKLMGDEARAKVALDDAMLRAYGIQFRRYAWGEEWLGDYGSSVRDTALAYALLNRHEIQHAKRENLLFDLAERVGGRQYYSTQERLALFLAARAAGGKGGGEWTALLKTGDASQALSAKATEQRSFDAATLARGITLTNQHGGPLFIEAEASGYPLRAPTPRNDVIELRRDWFEADGRAYGDRPLKVGDMLIVRLQARARARIEDAMLIDRVPAGFEIENLNLSQGPKAEEFSVGGVNVGQAMADSRIKHREYRDDRYVAAARLDGSWLTVFYMVRVVSPGRFVVPPAFAEDMYKPELRAIGTQPAPITIGDPRGMP
jgi:alpha-2-macroglobulin